MMAKSNIGKKHPKYISDFYMIDFELNKRYRFSSTLECEKFAKQVLGLTLGKATVIRKLNGISDSPYQGRYIFERCKD